MQKNNWGLVGLFALMVFGLAVSSAEATGTFTIDLASATTDAVAAGVAILAVCVSIYGFRIVRRMVGH